MGAFFHAAANPGSGQATDGGDDDKGRAGELSGARCQLAHSLLCTVKYMKQLIDMRELKQAQQTGRDTTEHNLAVSAKRLKASDKRPQATTIDELKRRHIYHNTFVPTLHQVDEPGFKLWGKIGVQPFGMDLDDDNISAGLDRKWHRTSSQERRGAWRSRYGLAGYEPFAATPP
jgi:hypothetical protein